MSRFDAAFARLDAFVEQQMAAINIPGIAIGLTDRDGLLRVSTYGYADLAARIPVEHHHRFAIGSVTKSFTAIAILQLHDQGLIDLHAPVTEYLPWFQVQSGHGPITPHHLLSHSSGIVRGSHTYPDIRFRVWALRETIAEAPPGDFFWYSNSGFATLGLLLETIVGKSVGEIVRERILDPLGMNQTDAVITHDVRARHVVGYQSLYDDRPDSIGDPLVPVPWGETDAPEGCIASTPHDMATYARMLLNRGSGPQGRILSEESFALMTQPLMELVGWPDASAYGYGLAVGAVDGRPRFAHGGGWSGQLTSLVGDLADGIGVVVLMNAEITAPHQFSLYALEALNAALHDRTLPAIPPRPEPLRVGNATAYAGRYSGGGRTLTIVADGERLLLEPPSGPPPVVLENKAWDSFLGWGPDEFLARHPDFDRFLLRFEREMPGDAASPIVGLSHGSDWYAAEPDLDRRPAADYPQQWECFVGHYRRDSASDPFENFRIVLRKGTLLMVDYSWNTETPLVELSEGLFRIGEDKRIPERIRFDAIVDGQALRANVSGADFYRFFTP